MWHGNWLKLSEEFANVINCGKHQHNVADLKNSMWTFLTGIDKGYLRIHGLDPFLFGEPYSSSLLTNWAKEANLLPIQGVIQDGVADKHTKQAVLLIDTVIYHATLALHMLTVAASTCDIMRERFLQYQKICGELNQCFKLDDAMKCVARDELYHIVQKHASEGLLDKKMGAAAFLISYKLFDNMLETAETNIIIKEFQDEWNVDAKKWKEMGNEEYKDGQFLRAVANYTMAVKTNRYSAVLYGNRAQAYLKLGKLDEAELDGRRAVVLKPRWCKGYLRLAQAVEGQNRLHEAHCIASYGIKSCDEIPFFKDTLRIMEEKAVKKCKSEGYCSKKTKKISDHNEKIKSTQHINTVNDLADSNMENHWPSDVPELTDSDSNSDYSNDIACDAIEEYGDTSIEKFKNLLGLGSEHFIASRYQCAVDCFEATLGEINSSLDMYSKLEIEPICLAYALGISYVAAGSSENIQKAIVLFTKHLKDSDIEKLPAIYYGLGWAYVKLNKFKEAEDPLTKCLQILKTKTSLVDYMWPGSTHIIEETQKERLEVVVQELFETCSNPPEPDAACRYHLCKLDKKIYYSDPDFKGLCLVRCHDQCSVEYHPGCWKLLKESLKRTDKEFLGQNCLTPDCNSTVVLVKIEDKLRIVVKEFEDNNVQKNKPLQKHRKNKLEKKFEQKERRKRKRQENQHSSKQTSEHAERNACHSEQESVETDENNIQENCLVETKEEKNESFQAGLLENNKSKESLSTQLTYTTNSVPVCILKKSEVDVPLKDQKAKKQKERKKQKSKNIMSIEEFCDGTEEFSVFNEYQQRLKRLEENKRMIEEGDDNWVDFCEKNEHIPQLDPSRPFYIDKSLRENTVALDAILQLCGGVGETEEIRSMRESVYSYMEDFLHSKGPVHKNDDILLNEIKCFSPETQNLIAQSGGLEKFLLNSMNFAVANDYICLLSDVVTVYSLPAYEKPATYLDSLDTFDDFQQYDKTNNLLDSENDTLLDPTISTLNPHARVYNPVQQITDCSNRYLVEDVGKEFLENMDLSKNMTISDFSNETLLVQNKCDKNEDKETEKMQYVKDENSSINKEGFLLSNNNFNCVSQNCNNYENGELSKTTNLVQNNDFLSFDSHSIKNNSRVLCKEMPYQQLIEVVVSMLNRLSDYKVCQERTADVLNKKLNCFQITLLGAKGKPVFPTELNYAELQKRIACLEDEKDELEQRVVENLDTITLLRKEHLLEIATLESSLEDSISVQKKLEKELEELIMLHDNKSRQWQQERTELQEENKTLKEDLASVSQELENLTTEKNEMILQIEKLQSEVQTEIENKNDLQKTIDSLYKKSEEHRTEKLVLSEQLAQLRKECSPPSIVPPNFHCYYPRGPLPASIPPSTYFPRPHPTPMRSHLDVLFPPRPNQVTGGIFAATPPPGLEIPTRILPEYSPRNDKLQEQLLSPIPPISFPPVKQLCEATTSTETFEATSSFARSYESISNFAKPTEPTSSYLKQSDSTNSLVFNSKELSFGKSSATMDDETKKINSSSDISHLNHTDIAVASSSDSYHKPTPITIVNWNSSIRNGTDTKKATVGRLPPKLPSDGQKNSFEKLMSRLQNQFPTISRKDLSTNLKEYRAQHNNTLSGMTIDAIIAGVSTTIKKKQKCPNNKCHVPNQTSNTADQESVPAWTKRTAKMTPWNGKTTDCDSNCSICLEEMTPFVSFKVECGHSFHYRCIHEWVAKQSTCPICRIHVLLPDEFPVLGQP